MSGDILLPLLPLKWPIVAAMVVAVSVSIGFTGCGVAPAEDVSGASGVFRFEALLAGRPIEESRPSRPVTLPPHQPVEVTLLMTNDSPQAVTVSHVRFEGDLLGFAMLSYDTAIDETLEANEQRLIRFPLDLFDLDREVHGLLRGRIALFDDQRRELAGQDLVVDGRGRVVATMSLFTIVLAIFTVAAAGWLVSRFNLGLLPPNPFHRGLSFGPIGLLLGLTMSAASSTFRVWPLSTPAWLGVTVLCGVAAVVVGWLAPSPPDPLRYPAIDLTDGRTQSSPDSITRH